MENQSNQEIIAKLRDVLSIRLTEVQLIQLKDAIENEYYQTFDRLYTGFITQGYAEFLAFLRCQTIYLHLTGKGTPWRTEKDFLKLKSKMK